MAKYKHYKFKEVIDWQGEAWDVYEEYKSPSGIMIYRGWPYGLTPRDGIGGIFSYIYTPEISEFIKTHSIKESEQQLAVSLAQVAKFRRLLGITQKRFYRDDAWLLEHQEEILHDSLSTLEQKFGLTKARVYLQRKWLAELISFPTRKTLRKSRADEEKEIWYQEHKSTLKSLSVIEIAERYQISEYRAKKLYNRIRQEQDEPSTSEQVQQRKQTKQQWLLEHQKVLLDPTLSVDDIAQALDRTRGQVLRARAKLRTLSQTPKVTEQRQAWLLDHQDDLLNRELSLNVLAERWKMTPSRVSAKRSELRVLLNLPSYIDELQQWRLENQDILLSMDLSIREIATHLNRSETSVVKDRAILRKSLKLSQKALKDAWLLERQNDFSKMTMNDLQQKYQLEKRAIKRYQQRLAELMLLNSKNMR